MVVFFKKKKKKKRKKNQRRHIDLRPFRIKIIAPTDFYTR